MNIKNNILETIGNTPLVKINKITAGCFVTRLTDMERGNCFEKPAALTPRLEIAIYEISFSFLFLQLAFTTCLTMAVLVRYIFFIRALHPDHVE